MTKMLSEYKKIETFLKFREETQKKEAALIKALSPTAQSWLAAHLGEDAGRRIVALAPVPLLPAARPSAPTSTYNTVAVVMQGVMRELNKKLNRGCTIKELYSALQRVQNRDRAHIPSLGTVTRYLHIHGSYAGSAALWKKTGSMPNGGKGANLALYTAI